MEYKKTNKFITDEITERKFYLKKETLCSKISAIVGLFYSLGAAAFFLYLIFSGISGNFLFVKKLFNISGELSGDMKLLLFSFAGGALGSITKEIRSFIFWHCENKAYGKEFFWKVLSSPIFGGVLAVFIYAVLRSGILVLGAEFDGKSGDISHKIFSIFAISFLTGFGSEKAIQWINFQVKNLFKEALKKEKKNTSNISSETKKKNEDKKQKEKTISEKEKSSTIPANKPKNEEKKNKENTKKKTKNI
jgi:hypothetical protein